MITHKTFPLKSINWQEIANNLAEKGDLPATSKILRIVTALKPEDPLSAQDLAALILKDYGLTKKVIRLANSCFYNPHGVEIATVSKAIIFLGFEVIRKIALASNYLEEILKKTPPENRKTVLALLSHSFFGAFLASKLSEPLKRSQEEFFIHVLFHRLVRVLLAMYYHQTYLELCQLEKKNPLQAKEILYLIGERLGRKWSFPRLLIEVMEGSPQAADEKHPASLIASLDAAVQAVIRENDRKPLKRLLKKHRLDQALADHLIEMAYKATKDLYQPLSKHLTFQPEEKEEPQERASYHEEFFQKALSEITALLASPKKNYQEVLFMVMETICRAFECENVLFGLYNPKEKGLVIRYAVGAENGRLKKKILPVGSIITDIFRKRVEWAGKKSTIPEFSKIKELPERDILFSPLIVFEKPVGMIIALRKRPFSTEETQKVTILRNLAVMGITQAYQKA